MVHTGGHEEAVCGGTSGNSISGNSAVDSVCSAGSFIGDDIVDFLGGVEGWAWDAANHVENSGTKVWHRSSADDPLGDGASSGDRGDLPSRVSKDGTMIWSRYGRTYRRGLPAFVSDDGIVQFHSDRRPRLVLRDNDAVGVVEYAGISYSVPYWMMDAYCEIAQGARVLRGSICDEQS